MLLMTFQSLDYLTYKNPRYSRIKKLLNIPDDKNVYWCCAANSLEQAVINAYCIEPNEPQVFVMFETDDFHKIDKIKWNRYVEKNLKEDDTFDMSSLLNIEHKDAVEYIVTDIPENRFSICVNLQDMSEFLNMFVHENMTDVQKSIFYSLNTDSAQKFLEDFKEMSEGMDKNASTFSVDVKNREALLQFRLFKYAFDGNMLPYIYLIGHSSLKPDDESVFGKSFLTLDYVSYTELHNTYAHWCVEAGDRSDDEAYDMLKGVYKKIYEKLFVIPPDFERKVMPNEPCPCGSGLKYKKCCKIAKKTPDICDVMLAGL